jgi:hypothetical protein
MKLLLILVLFFATGWERDFSPKKNNIADGRPLPPIYRKELNSMHERSKNRIIAELIINGFNQIYNQILNDATGGKNASTFEMEWCRNYHYNSNYDECQPDTSSQPNTIRINNYLSIPMPYDLYTYFVLQQLNQSFPDSTIVRIKQPCCVYQITW